MNLICKIFGHRIKQFSYGKYHGGCTDGIGREHGFYSWECERCPETVSLYVHFPQRKSERKMNDFEKKYAKVMRQKEEITTDMVKFLFSAITFVVSTGKLAEFMNWEADQAMKNLTKKGGERDGI